MRRTKGTQVLKHFEIIQIHNIPEIPQRLLSCFETYVPSLRSGYAGSILGALGVPLMLGSWWTFAPAGAVILLFIIRTKLEDQTLRKELEGYEAYAQRTRFRLLPGIW